MTRRNDGGPAFPAFLSKGSASYNPGMTLREYFAAHAPPMPDGIVDTLGVPGEIAEYRAGCEAVWRHLYADAMLLHREEKSE